MPSLGFFWQKKKRHQALFAMYSTIITEPELVLELEPEQPVVQELLAVG